MKKIILILMLVSFSFSQTYTNEIKIFQDYVVKQHDKKKSNRIKVFYIISFLVAGTATATVIAIQGDRHGK